MEIKHSVGRRNGIVRAGVFLAHVETVDQTEVSFNEEDKEANLPAFFKLGRGDRDEYCKVLEDGTIIIEANLSDEDVEKTIKLGRERWETSRYYEEIHSPLLSDVPAPRVTRWQPPHVPKPAADY